MTFLDVKEGDYLYVRPYVNAPRDRNTIRYFKGKVIVCKTVEVPVVYQWADGEDTGVGTVKKKDLYILLENPFYDSTGTLRDLNELCTLTIVLRQGSGGCARVVINSPSGGQYEVRIDDTVFKADARELCWQLRNEADSLMATRKEIMETYGIDNDDIFR